MSDYLNNLVERTLKVAPVVEPRLASLFESGSEAAGVKSPRRFEAETETHGNESSGELKRGASDSVPANVQTSQLPPRISETNEANLLDSKKRGVSQESERPPNSPSLVVHQYSPLPASVVLPAPVAGHPVSQEPEGSGNHPPARERTGPFGATANESGQSLKIERDRGESRPPPQPEIRQRVDGQLSRLQRPGADADERNGPEPSGPVAASTSRIMTERPDVAAIKPTPQTVRERVATTEPAQRMARQFLAATTPRPTIKVTIGRVDVRAIVSQPSQTPRVARAQPSTAMSLDEYLKQRSEGHR